MYKLYTMLRSGNSYKVRMLLARLDIRYRLIETDIFKGETRTPDFLMKNPEGHVPVLELPDRRYLSESNAILVYLARTNPAAGLLPSNPAAEARCIEWMNWLASNVHAMSYGQIWRPRRFIDDERQFPALKAKGEQSVREQYAYIESLLADGREWAVPGGYTVVDPYLLVFYRWGQRIGLDMKNAYPAWTHLTERVVARSAVQRALAKEQIKIFL